MHTRMVCLIKLINLKDRRKHYKTTICILENCPRFLFFGNSCTYVGNHLLECIWMLIIACE